MSEQENISVLKQHDNDKYLALIFAKEPQKAQLAALFNFHYQLSQIPLEVSENMVGLIKLQWWRDALAEIADGKPPRPHPVLLGLRNSNINLEQLQTVINNYEKLLDNWQPRNFEELEEFIQNTDCIIFEQAANILETLYSENTAKSYSYTAYARKISRNGRFSGKFVTEPAVMSQKLVAKAQSLHQKRNTVFDLITGFYLNRFNRGVKNIESGRWKLTLKLAFSGASIL